MRYATKKQVASAEAKFTPEELKAIKSAASHTYHEIAMDLPEGRIAVAVEATIDADRMVTFAGLDRSLYKRFCELPYPVMCAIVREVIA